MTAKEFFTNKPKPTFLEENPKSCDDYDREMLTQFCYDAGLEDDEIEPTVQSLIDWKNKRAEEYADIKSKEAYEAGVDLGLMYPEKPTKTYEQWKQTKTKE